MVNYFNFKYFHINLEYCGDNMNEKNKSTRRSKSDPIPEVEDILDENLLKGLEDYEPRLTSFSLDPEYDYYKKLGITDEIYIQLGHDLRWLKRFNPKGKIIF